MLHRVVWVGITVIRHRILFAWGKHPKYIGVQDGIRAYRVEKNRKLVSVHVRLLGTEE